MDPELKSELREIKTDLLQRMADEKSINAQRHSEIKEINLSQNSKIDMMNNNLSVTLVDLERIRGAAERAHQRIDDHVKPELHDKYIKEHIEEHKESRKWWFSLYAAIILLVLERLWHYISGSK